MTQLADLGDCQNTLLADASDSQQLVVNVVDGNIYFTHEHALFNCCVDSVTLAVQLDGADITVTETDYCSNPCHCACPRDLEGVIAGLGAGTYSLAVCDTNGAVLSMSEVTIN